MRRSETELGTNKSLMTRLFGYEHKYRQTQTHLDQTEQELHDLQAQNQALQTDIQAVQRDKNTLQNFCTLLERQNRELQSELQRFKQTDQRIVVELAKRV